jgi:hypothetical protein
MVINSPNAVLFDTTILIASVLDANNQNCGAVITVTWTAVTGAVYQLERRTNGGAWTVVYIGVGLTFSESGNPGLYEYRVKVIKGSKSAYSNIDGVSVVAQNTQVNTYCVGYDLWETFTSGCGVNTRLLQPLSPTCGVVYGCTDPTASNYNPSATHSNGSCTWNVVSCTEKTPPYWVDYAGSHTITYTAKNCALSGSGTLTGFSYKGFAGSDNLTHWITGVSYSYVGSTITIHFTTTGPWFYAEFSWTGVQRLS